MCVNGETLRCVKEMQPEEILWDGDAVSCVELYYTVGPTRITSRTEPTILGFPGWCYGGRLEMTPIAE